MTKFSANLGFLWNTVPLPDAIHAAANAGFDAVECHWPYEYNARDVNAALKETNLKMLGLNTVRGDVKAGENGLSALPGREKDARLAIDQAIAYAQQIDCQNIHVMAGFASGQDAETAFIGNLKYASQLAAQAGQTILIEPLNTFDAPGYFLVGSRHARRIIEAVGAENVKLMFDCYHLQIMEGDLSRSIRANLDIIGHIQFAGVPSRGRPDDGEVNFAHLFSHIAECGYHNPLGAEYKPLDGDTDASLGWMLNYR